MCMIRLTLRPTLSRYQKVKSIILKLDPRVIRDRRDAAAAASTAAPADRQGGVSVGAQHAQGGEEAARPSH